MVAFVATKNCSNCRCVAAQGDTGCVAELRIHGEFHDHFAGRITKDRGRRSGQHDLDNQLGNHGTDACLRSRWPRVRKNW